MMKKAKKESSEVEESSIPTPESLLDPDGNITRTEVFDFTEKGGGKRYE